MRTTKGPSGMVRDELLARCGMSAQAQGLVDEHIEAELADAVHATVVAAVPYRTASSLNFGQAIEALKAGNSVARAGWNGKGMWLTYVGGDEWENVARGIDDNCSAAPFIAMRTAQQTVVPWLASQTDILAEDYEVVT